MFRVIPVVLTLLVLIIGASSSGCGGKDRGGVAPLTSQGYIFSYPSLESRMLQNGENPVFKQQIKTNEDLLVDRLGARFEFTGVAIRRVEVRDSSSALTLPNSIVSFPTPPTSPLEMPIIMNQSISGGSTKTYIVVIVTQSVITGSALRMVLLRTEGRTRFAEIPPFTTPVEGDTLIH